MHVIKQGKTPVLTADEAKGLLASISPEKKKDGSGNDATDQMEEEPEPPPWP